MNTASEVVPASLAQRIAKVRNCMLVEALTGISPTDGDLFASLCQMYEQQNAGTSTSCLSGELYKPLSDWMSSVSNQTHKATQSAWPISLITNGTDFSDGPGFSDWENWNDR